MHSLLISYFLEYKVVCVFVCIHSRPHTRVFVLYLTNVIYALKTWCSFKIHDYYVSKHNFTYRADFYEEEHNVILFCEI